MKKLLSSTMKNALFKAAGLIYFLFYLLAVVYFVYIYYTFTK